MRSLIGRLLLTALVGCSADASVPDTTLPLSDTALDDPDDTTVASELAPSQVAASTAPPPATPSPCGDHDVELWTAAIRPAASTADAVIRMRNVGTAWCEVDIGRSPRLDPTIEPDVWLQPGDTADLVVGQAEEPCQEPALVTAVQVGVGDTSVVVPSALVACAWMLTALYPNDPVTAPCERRYLDVVATAGAVVIGTSSPAPCLIEALTAVDGIPLTAPSTPPRAVEMFPGDVLAVGTPRERDCDGATSRTLRFGVSLDVVVDDVPCGLQFESASPSPWYGMPNGPTVADDAGIDEILDALDPFGPRE